MMKPKDASVATSLLIQGYLHANSEETDPLIAVIKAIRQECYDWAENIKNADDDGAMEPNQIEIELTRKGADLTRSPYTLISAALSLINEAGDLAGPGAITDLQDRLGKRSSDDDTPILIEAADTMAAEIDAATERPVQKIAAWNAITATLRSRGIKVEEVCTAVQNW